MTVRRAYLETGDLTEFNAYATDGGDLSVEAGVGKFGAYGLQAVIDDTTAIYAQLTETLSGELWIGSYIKLSDPFTGVDGKLFTVLNAAGPTWNLYLYASYTIASGWRWYFTRPRLSSHHGIYLSYFNLGQWYWVEMHLKRATGGSATDGECHVWIDDVLVHDENNYDNNPPASTNTTYGRVGSTYFSAAGFAGTVYCDHFILSNEGRIYMPKRNLLTGCLGGPIQ